ncbi:MAG: Rossmann-like fold-containing protein [Candidatus Delongbacteria bacterium]
MSIIRFKQKDFSVPLLFRELISPESSFAYVELNRAKSFNRIIKYLRSGKFLIIMDSSLERADILYKKINERIDEIIPFDKMQNISSKSFSRNRKREFDKLKSNLLNRVLLVSRENIIISFLEEIRIPYLISFCGENPNISDLSKEYLLPFKFFIELKESLDRKILIKCSEFIISSGINVLLPKSQETSELFKNAMTELKRNSGIRIIDMGCGSGILTLIANSVFEDSEIHFADILPEALASTLNNLDKNISGINNNNSLICHDPCDLFENMDELFDLIIFNPPWVNAEAENRKEYALNDRGQKLLERFMIQAKNRLMPDGKIVIAYSDNGGEKSVIRFNQIAEQNGFVTEKEYSAKVQSYQSGRKRMRIFVRILKPRDLN